MSKERELQLLAMYEPALAKSLADARLSEARLHEIRVVVQRLAADLGERRRWHEATADDLRRERRLAADLRHHLRDRDAHIKNLEEQLRPILANSQAEAVTEPML